MKNRRACLITGASTGIGYAIAERLCQRGWKVFAGYRAESAKGELAKMLGANGEPLKLDVTKAAEIDAARTYIQSKLQADEEFTLINNAGIAVAGVVEALTSAELRRQFDINVFGLIDVTRAFLPLLRTHHGRIINMSSISGRVSFPGLSAYTSSKFAVEAISDALRLELKPFHIPVVLIQPGAVKTPIWDKSRNEFYQSHNSYSEEMKHLYARVLEAMGKAVEHGKKTGVSAELVAAVTEKALNAKTPRTRYLVGTEAKVAGTLKSVLPDRWMDRLLEKMN